MLLVIQFPLADSRSFLDDPGRINKPVWKQPEPDVEFLRYFGAIRERRAGGILNWGVANENIVCEANRAFAFRSSLTYRAGLYELPLRRAFGRFFFDGSAMGKFEVGLATKSYHAAQASQQQLRDLVQHVLDLPVQVRSPLAPLKTCQLAQAGEYLAQLYLLASTYNRLRAESSPPGWHVLPGKPLLFLEYEPRDKLETPSGAEAIDLPSLYGLRLHHYTVQFAGRRLHMWLFGMTAKADREKARSLRLLLLRLHSEHECLRQVLRNLMTGKLAPARGSAPSDRLQEYFTQATKRIKGWESDSDRQFAAEIPALARAAAGQLNPGAVEMLLANVESWDPRRSVTRKLREYVDVVGSVSAVNLQIVEGNVTNEQGDRFQGDQINVSGTSGGVVNVKSTVGDITQNIGNIASADQATKDELKKLVEQLGALLQKAPATSADDAAAVADAARQAVDAAAKPKPNKTTVQITAEGLKKAAENIKAVLPEVLTIATQIAATVMRAAGVI